MVELEPKLIELKKRTYQTFLGQVEEKVQADEEIVKSKFEKKFEERYKDLGKIPGVLVEEMKRRKILKELGVAEEQ